MEFVIIILVFLTVGVFLGFLIGKIVIRNYVSNNFRPDENFIRLLLNSMGVQPNKKKINQILKSLELNKTKKI